MKRQSILWARRYASSLRSHLRQGRRADPRPGRALGRRAVALGLETLDVARVHEEAFAACRKQVPRDRALERAQDFFVEVIGPIELTHRAARNSDVQLRRLAGMLKRRSSDLAVTNRSLRKMIARRKATERALTTSARRGRRFVRISGALGRRMRHATHGILGTQETKRKELSLRLQNEIAQSLAGINVRLLSLKLEAAATSQELRREIMRTRRLVATSLQSIRRVARDIR